MLGFRKGFEFLKCAPGWGILSRLKTLRLACTGFMSNPFLICGE